MINSKCNFCGKTMPQKRNKKYCSDKCRVFSFRERNGIKPPEFLNKGGFQPLGSLNTDFNHKTIEGLKSLYNFYFDIFNEKSKLLDVKKLERISASNTDYSPLEKLTAKKKNIELPKKSINWQKIIDVEFELNEINKVLEEIKPYLNFTSNKDIVKGLISKEIERIKNKSTEKVKPKVEVIETKNHILASDLMKQNLNFYDFSNSEFEFLSNPGIGFICLVTGEPFAGKTYFSLKFADFLTNFGTVLFISNEEKMKFSLVNKLNFIFNGKEPKFVISDNFEINEVLNYDFIFMDSINSIGASILDLKNLQSKNKNIIGILQSTKNGDYKGSKELQHEADIMINIEKNKSVSVIKNRF